VVAEVVHSHCPPTPACCVDGVVVSDDSLAGGELVVAEGIIAGTTNDTFVESVIDTTGAPAPVVESQPTPAPDAQAPVAAVEPPAAGLVPAVSPPALAPAGEAGDVQTTSSEEPLAMPAAPAPVAEQPAAAPAEESVLANEAGMQPPAGDEAVGSPVTPAEPVPPAEPPAPAAEAVAQEVAEPDMKTEEPLPSEEPAPAAEPPMEEDVAPETPVPVEPEPMEPEPMEPEPAVEPQPEPAPEDGNIFEELDAEGGEAAPASEEDAAMAEEPAAGEPEEPGADPFGDAETGEPAAEPAMTEEEPPMTDQEPVAPEGGDSEPADPFARGEPARRWIDASGTASMVATLIEVGADGRCVLETRGRRIAVPVENLSGHDRDYVRQAGVRLAKSRTGEAGETAAAAPSPTDTAGL
jgi:hypothetical protein